VSQPDREPVFCGQLENAPDVIFMLMCDQDAGKMMDIYTKPPQTG
jgi:hypothetical protein